MAGRRFPSEDVDGGKLLGEFEKCAIELLFAESRLEPGKGIQHDTRYALLPIDVNDGVQGLVDETHGVQGTRSAWLIGIALGVANQVDAVREQACGGEVGEYHVAGDGGDIVSWKP